MEALTRALRLANAEMTELRRQCDDLRSMVRSQRSASDRSIHSPVLDDSPAVRGQNASAQPSTAMNPDLPREIANITADEARQALAVSLLIS